MDEFEKWLDGYYYELDGYGWTEAGEATKYILQKYRSMTCKMVYQGEEFTESGYVVRAYACDKCGGLIDICQYMCYCPNCGRKVIDG